MNIGLAFKIPNHYGEYLTELLQNINVLDYDWKIEHEEIYHEDNNYIFGSPLMTGEQVKNCLAKTNYYLIFLDIKAYPVNTNYDNVKTLRDFLHSNCEFIFLCTDSEFIEIYSKNQAVIEKIHHFCTNRKYSDIQYIEDADLERNLIAW